MLVGTSTLQRMDLQIPEILTFISGDDTYICREGIIPKMPRSNFTKEVVRSMSVTDIDPWWLHSEHLGNDPQVVMWTYQGSKLAVLTLVDHQFHQ
jgi:hypothetical protein